MPKGKELKLKICNFVNSKFKLPKKYLIENKEEEHDGNIYYEYNFVPELTIHSDIKITIKEDLKFFMWVNLWYSTWEAIKDLYDKKFFKNSPSKSVKELNYHKFDLNKNNNEISGEEDEQINNIKINSIQNGFISNEINENNIQLKSNASNSLYDIIYQMKHNNDLNELIDKINSDYHMGFSRDMTIKLNAFEFDKFHEKNDYSNLEMTIYYCISEK